MPSLTLSQARRIALDAQGLARPRPGRAVSSADLQRTIDRVAQFQVDSVNVLARAHHLPLFSRFGPYPPDLLERASGRAPRRLVEYWGHAASLVDVSLLPALRFRMEEREDSGWIRRVVAEHPELPARVLAEVAQAGPLTARQIVHEEERRRDHWGWNWSAVKVALEWHFDAGRLSVAGRTSQFERLYDLPERVLPPWVDLGAGGDERQQRLTLARRAAHALGVFSLACLADYFHTRRAPTAEALSALQASGEVEPVTVQGWDRPTWRVVGSRVPRRATGSRLLSPFDSMMFQRDRIEALFGYRYRIEIYTPAPKRVHGYYVLSFLVGEEFVARVDLKADRATGRLLVRSSWLEPVRTPAEDVARALAGELALVAGWLGLDEVVVEPRGDLAPQLHEAVRTSSPGQLPPGN